MKKKTVSKGQINQEKCNRASCHICVNCKATNFEEHRSETKNTSLQLYAKEVESYFFYYALQMKQMQ